MVKSILIATDFSERSDRAVQRASMLARETDARLSLVHVVDDDKPAEMARTEAGTAARRLSEQADTLQEMYGISCDSQVIVAAPFAGILEAAEKRNAALLVLGPHRRRVLHDVFIGTTAERTIRAAPRPVLMANAPPTGRYRNILLTTDMTELSRTALAVFHGLGISGQARLSIAHVFEDSALRLAMGRSFPAEDMKGHQSKSQEKAYHALFEFLEGTGLDLRAHHVRLNMSSPADEIMEVARETDAELLVVGTHGKTGMDKLFLGSVAEQVLRLADIDVLVLPCR